MSPRLALGLATVAALAGPAAAQRIEYSGHVDGSPSNGPMKTRVGAPRYVALTPLLYGMDDARVEVLDLDSNEVHTATTTRDALIEHFGRRDPMLGGSVPPEGELVFYRPDRSGMFFTEWALEGKRRTWYAEIDRSGAIARVVDLGGVGAGERLEFAGCDGDRAWWVLWRRGEAVLRRLDLATLAVTDPVAVKLQRRESTSGYEDQYFVHASGDFSRFAIVEYFEDGLRMDPGKIYVVEPARRSWFAIPAPSTAYGVAFTADGRYMFLGSCQHGTVSRVDLAARRTDRTMAGPRFLHHLVLGPDGRSLYALASSREYSVYDLELRRRTVRAHAREVAGAAAELFGGGVSSAGFFVVQGARDGYLVARFTD